MAKRKLDLDLDRCVGCFACVVACNDQHYDINEEGPSLRQVVSYENEEKRMISTIAISCMHCEDTPCLFACPTGAIYKDAESGLVQVDRSKCIGCHSCLMACPFGAPKFDSENKMTKCDGCLERVKHGLEPVCVKTCPSGAIKFEETSDIEKEKLDKRLRHILGK
jgi:anaerobic dimethyl sulfoxide reductase subunit B